MAYLFNEKDKKLDSAWKTVTLYQYDKEKQANVPLVENKDYTVAMDNNGSIGKFSLVFTGINGYSGTIIKTITVKAFNFKNNKDGTKKYAGTVVQATDKVAPGTVIKVNLTVKCSEKSPYTSAENGTVLTGYYRVIDNATNISKFSVKVKDLKKLAYNDSKAVMPLKASDIEISYKKKVAGKNTTIVLNPSDYEIVSISNNKLIGKATVVIRGKNEYGGQKTFSFNIKARSFAN